MISIDIPGFEPLHIEHVLLDYNGTLAVDGMLVPGVVEIVSQLVRQVHVAVLTADTYGTVRQQCEPLGVEVQTFPRAGATAFKKSYAQGLEGDVACLGNGRNDADMFDCAALSIAILDGEGMWVGLVPHADILARSAVEGLSLLLNADRIRATLRS